MKQSRKENAELRKILTELLNDPMVFKNWLIEQDKKRNFSNGSMCGCPLYKFLTDHLLLRKKLPLVFEVDCDRVRWKIFDEQRRQYEVMPLWARRFSTLDFKTANNGILKINKDYALNMLEEVLQRGE